MDRLLDVQTALSLGYVASMILAAHLSSLHLLPSNSTRKTRLIFLWLAFDCICHLTLEGSFLYLSTQSRTVNKSSSFFGYLWQEYAAADARWGEADPTLVSMEWITVLLAGPLAGWCAWLLAKGEGVYHYWVVVLSVGELYGGWMTFAPEWLSGSKGLETEDWLLLWVYLVFMNLVWVAVPAWLMLDSYRYIAECLRESSVTDTTVAPVAKGTAGKQGKRKSTQPGSTERSLSSTRGLGGSAYLLLLAAVFFYIMPTASATSVTVSSTSSKFTTYDPSATTTIFPPAHEHTESLFTTLKNTLIPLLIPLFLITFSLFVGAIQVVDKALRRVRKTNRIRRRKLLSTLSIDEKKDSPRRIIGFFHPYCNAGGGGERVLYEAISLHLTLDTNCIIAIYTGDYPTASKEDILTKASSRFGITLDPNRILFVGLKRRWMVEDSTWKSFTLLGQSYGSVWLGFEALSSLIPDVWVDTMGYAFTYPVVRLFNRGVSIGAYVHYPVISTDMLKRVEKRQAGHTNDANTANSRLRSMVKSGYYRVFAKVYSWVLGRADAVVGNGSWTANHLTQLLGGKKKVGVKLVYPPCDTEQMATFPLENRSRIIVSLAQFRPEKEHPQQLYILKELLDNHPEFFKPSNPVKLILMGSSRNEEDEKRITLLRQLSTSLGLDDYVEFVVNANFSHILERLKEASVGISTMKDEHFGINVVEFMASGLITVSHKSAGPWLDIAYPSANKSLPLELKKGKEDAGEQPTGYHAESVQEFAQVLAEIFETEEKQPEEVLKMRKAARERAQRVFGREAFTQAWQQELWSKLVLKLDGAKPKDEKKD